MNYNLERLAAEISNLVEEELIKMGLLYRLFYRAKSTHSIEKKQEIKKYSASIKDKKMQDLVGIRVALYFADDVEIVRETLKRKFEFVDETVDISLTTEFKPTRINLIFRFGEYHTNEINDTAKATYPFIDNTFEIQLRTVLSEGWHEVDHDLRYKCQEDWHEHKDLERTFNGVFAGLETSDWSTLMIFEKLSHRHYKSKSWQAMLRTKFRLRLDGGSLDTQIAELLNKDNNLAKKLYRIDRDIFLKELVLRNLKIPFTLSNLIYACNCMFIGDKKLYDLTPKAFLGNKALNKIKVPA
ncbi:MAG: RelA/SpoT domain-containing protein [Marinoscillum sp.]